VSGSHSTIHHSGSCSGKIVRQLSNENMPIGTMQAEGLGVGQHS
jgi:hypothetical protein